MKLQSLAIVLASCLSSATAQGLTGLPTCAQDCATGSIPKECSLIDIECICGSESFIADMACCVGKSCEKADQDAALDFANGLCEGAGISNLPQTATCTGDSNSTATSTSTGTTTATESTSTGSETTATTTTKPEETSSTTTESSTDTATESSNETSSETSTSAASETPAEPQESDGAAQLRGKGLSLVAGIAAGAAFLM